MNSSSNFSVIALVAALIAGTLGAGAWALLYIYGGLEHGMLAWAVGGLVGFATLQVGGRGKPMAVTAAAVALLAIFAGKFVAMRGYVSTGLDQENYEASRDDVLADSKAVLALGENPSDEQLAQVIVERGYFEGTTEEVTPDLLSWFRDEQAPHLREFNLSEFTFESWVEDEQARIDLEVEEMGGYVGLVTAELNGLDLLFLFLGISTAFGLVSRGAQEHEESLAENSLPD